MSIPVTKHDYITQSEANMEKKAFDIANNKDLNYKATELRLGLPGSQSPEREAAVVKIPVAGAKRGFLDTINGGSGKWVFAKNGGSEVDLVNNGGNKSSGCVKEGVGLVSPKPSLVEKKTHVSVKSNGQTSVPVPKQQVVGWPPIRSFRKNTMAISNTKNEENGDPKVGSGCLYVKVSMDGAPYLRKVDLEIYSSYLDLSSALEKMFSCFTIGQYGSHEVRTREGLSETRLMDLLHGSEYVLTYEDKDGDWMLVGDVPWDMFIASCKRLRIMKSSDAIGLAPLAREKSRNCTEPNNE
uniref:Auxin-responsive protein n=1 Tax=Ambrosia artemisiifolia TaxID=4212 RepID=A0A4P8PIU3_AMBAR|nr:putative auxin-responsive protein IAA27 [Ambrosia artemisiifolia]